MKPTIQTPFTMQQHEEELNTLPSLTVPDQSMSVDEILQRFATGRPIPDLSSKMTYTGDQYLPDLKRLDLVEQQELIDRNKQHINDLEGRLKQRQQRVKQLTIDSEEAKIKQPQPAATNVASEAAQVPKQAVTGSFNQPQQQH